MGKESLFEEILILNVSPRACRMLSSTFTHAILFLSSVILLLLLLLVCTIQLPIRLHAYSVREPVSLFNYSQQPVSIEVMKNASEKLKRTTRRSTTQPFSHPNGSSSLLHRLTFSNPLQSICNSLPETNATLVIIVLSRAVHFDHRQAIRATWGRNGKHESHKMHVKTIFFVGTDDRTQIAIRNEQTVFGDVVEIGKTRLKTDRRN